MCEQRHGGSIYSDCRDRIFRLKGSFHVSNKEMRGLLAVNNGCMRSKKVDKPTKRVLVSA